MMNKQVLYLPEANDFTYLTGQGIVWHTFSPISRFPHHVYFSPIDAAAEEQSSAVKSILIVEDDVDIGNLLIQAIELETSYQAILATNAFEALKIVDSIHPDLFVLDYHLPRMNGLELYDSLHALETLKDTAALFMSADIPERELAMRNVSFLRKPFNIDDFVETIKGFLR
jgi:CheY-like chemotaxis protein